MLGRPPVPVVLTVVALVFPLVVTACASGTADELGQATDSEHRDVISSAEIDAALARLSEGEVVLLERPNYSILVGAHQGSAQPPVTHGDAGMLIHLRNGSGKFTIAGTVHDVGAGDVLHVPRNNAYQLDPEGGRLDYLAIRAKDDGSLPPRGSGGGTSLPNVVTADFIAEAFANNTQNVALGSTGTGAYTMNLVIYAGRPPPYESHAYAVDIAVIKSGAGVAEIGGTIVSPVETAPGEIRGSAVLNARQVPVAVGDVVVLPRLMEHHQQPTAIPFGYVLLKVWSDE